MNTKPMKKEYYVYKMTSSRCFGAESKGYRLPGTYFNKKVASEVMRLTIKALPESKYTFYWIDFDWVN